MAQQQDTTVTENWPEKLLYVQARMDALLQDFLLNPWCWNIGIAGLCRDAERAAAWSRDYVTYETSSRYMT